MKPLRTRLDDAWKNESELVIHPPNGQIRDKDSYGTPRRLPYSAVGAGIGSPGDSGKPADRQSSLKTRVLRRLHALE